MGFLKVSLLQNVKKLKGDHFETIKKFSEKTKNENYEKDHSAEKFKRGDPLGFLKLQFAAKYYKKLKGGPFGDKKHFKKVAQCRKNSKGVPYNPVPFCILR